MGHDNAFEVYDHFIDQHAEAIDFTPDGVQRYDDRITGTISEGPPNARTDYRAVVIPRFVGYENASRYRRWITLPKAHWAALTARPNNWRYFILMIGLLPDGQPWWSNLYEESELNPQFFEQMPSGFYRLDPVATAAALINDWDKDRPDTAPDVDPPHEAPDGPIPADPGDDGGRQPEARAAVKTVVDGGVSLMLDQGQMVLMDKRYLAGLEPRVVAALENIRGWQDVREKQGARKARV